MSSKEKIVESTAVENSLNDSELTREEFKATLFHEYKRVCNMLKFVVAKDEVDGALKEITERILDVPLPL